VILHTVGILLRLGNTSMDRGMVLLEQAWVFWLGDNLEEVKMWARCAEKEVASCNLGFWPGIGGSCASTGCSCCRYRGHVEGGGGKDGGEEVEDE
jgi:hypothetical protein